MIMFTIVVYHVFMKFPRRTTTFLRVNLVTILRFYEPSFDSSIAWVALMVLVDNWTIVNAIIFIVAIISYRYAFKNEKEDEFEEDEAKT